MNININLIPDCVIITDLKGRIIACNILASEKLGVTIGKSIFDYCEECGENREIVEVEKGSKVYECHILEFEKGKLYLFRDITDRKNLEKMLKESEQKYKTLVELSPDAIVVHDGNKILFANKRAAELAGVEEPEDLVGTPVMNFIHPEYVTLVKERIERTLRDKILATSAEERYVMMDGSVKDVETSASYITFNGEPAVLLVVRDVSDKKKMQQELMESEQKYRNFFENSLDIIAITDVEGRFVEVNKAFEEHLGYRREEVIGKSFRTIVSEEYASNIFEKYNEAFRSRESIYGVEFEAITKNGRRLFIEGNIRVLEKEGRVVGFFGNFRDITERKRLENELKRTNKLLRTINRINELIVREKDLQKLLEMAVQEIKEYSSYSWIALQKENKLKVISASGVDIEVVRRELEHELICVKEVIKKKYPTIFHKGNHPPECPYFAEHDEYNCYLVPLIHADKILGVMAIYSQIEISDEELNLLQTLADDISFAMNAMGLEDVKQRSLEQIEKNIEQFAIWIDKIRNPLAIISGAVEIWGDGEAKEKIFEAVNKIESIIERLEKGWLESEEVRKLLRRGRNEDIIG